MTSNRPAALNYVAPGFERVEDVFRDHAARHTQGGVAFAVTRNGEPVVDLVAGEQAPGVPWTPNTRTGVASVTKSWAVMCLQILFDRGEITLDMPVVDVWPEFGANGKEGIRLSHILDHTAGVLGVGDVASLLQWDGGGWHDLDAIAARLAAAKPVWEPGTRCGYHAITFGWLVGEIVRRVSGRTLGTFFREEIATPLGIRTAIGVPVAEQIDIAKSIASTELLAVPVLLRPLVKNVPGKLRDPNSLPGMAFLGDGTASIMDSIDQLMIDGRFQAAEVPASNGVTSARDLARLFAVLANGGELDGVRLFSEKSMDVFLAPGTPRVDEVMGDITNIPLLRQLIRKMATVQRTVGGYDSNRPRGKKPGGLGPNPRAIGTGGAGGHFALADPTQNLSAAFVRSAMDPSAATQTALLAALYDCVG